MNAQEARKETFKSIDELVVVHYERVMKQIQYAALKGNFGINYTNDYNIYVYKKLKELLEKENYKVHVYKHHGSGLIIEWK